MVPKEKQDTPTYYRKEQTTMSSTPSPKNQKMTEGNITKLLITFALPLFVGNLFQQFYNTVDSIVVGNFVSKTALAAVGSTDCIINTIIGFFTGLSTGASLTSWANASSPKYRIRETVSGWQSARTGRNGLRW